MSNQNGSCPICDAPIALPEKTEESEIINCKECQTRLVVEKLSPKLVLQQAPAIEEDWGQ